MFGLTWLSPSIAMAAGAALLAGILGAWTAHKLDQIPLSQARAETSALQSRYDGYKQAVAASAAKVNADTLAEKTRLEASQAALQEQLLQTQRNADARSKALLAVLAAAKPGETRPIGAIAGAYYDSLRHPEAP